MKKLVFVFLLLASLISSVFAGAASAAPASCDAQSSDTLVVFCPVNQSYTSSNELTVEGFVANVSNKEVSGLKAHLIVRDLSENIIAEDSFNSGSIHELVLSAGHYSNQSFSLAVKSKVDISRGVIVYFSCDAGKVGDSAYTSGIHLVAGNKEIKPEVDPFIQDGRTLVPLRAIFEALGAEVTWDEKNQTVKALKKGDLLELKIGERNMFFNGKATALEVPALIKDGSTFVPLRAVSEALSFDVYYGKDGDAVTIGIKGQSK